MALQVEGEDFGQERPPLAVVIKGILQDYPSGQIFKVRSTLLAKVIRCCVKRCANKFYIVNFPFLTSIGLLL